MLTPQRPLSFKLQEKLTQAQYSKLPALYYLSIDGGEPMRPRRRTGYLVRTMTRQRFKQASGKLRKAVSILTEKDIIIYVATEVLTLI